ncbi:MAG: ExeM/NucH family extracellular endonuclease [Gammaproteobacteria bacterium]|nr:ExeM/NucH family extracellular endonuclease [Gammaproteobacteria bacterium]MDH5262416.1 ExeM/NucH family extracellular endonuclease [Gammaproteobacteria bacterium]
MNFASRCARIDVVRLSYVSVLFVLACFASQSAFAQTVFINEFHYDNTGTDAGEAIEVAGPAGTDLTGWSLVLYNGSNGTVYNTIALSGAIPNQQVGYGTVTVSLPVNGLQNGSPDGIALVDAGSTLIQFLSYEGSFTGVGGVADGVLSADIGVAESSSSAIGDSLQLFGTGTLYTDFVWAGSAPNTFGNPNNGQTFSGGGPVVIINEVDSDTPGTDVAEFVELYDGGAGNTSLDGLAVVFFNGSNDLSYAAYDLDGFSTDADGYFVLGNAGVMPTPSITFASNGLQNGADAVALYMDDASNFASGAAVTTTNLVDALVYDTSDSDDAGLLVLLNAGQPQVNENGAGSGADHSNQRCPNGSGGALNTGTYAQFAPTPGALNVCVAPVRLLKIHEVQGNGPASPEVGNTVAIEGIVVGDFQDGASGTNGDLNGFHVQEEDADADADASTSEGIFIFNGSSPAVDVQIGDLVRVEGVVSEFNGMTEITSFTGVTVQSSGNPLPTAAVLSLPVSSVDDFEAYEGMYVTFPQALIISEYFNFDRFNEIVLTSTRHLTPTAEFEPGADAIAAANTFLLDKITLDDGRTTQNSDPAIHPNGNAFDLSNLFRGGDSLTDVTGVVDYSFGLYRIQPTQGANYASNNPRTTAPDDVGGSMRVASFNTLNYFSTLDDSGPICAPSQDQDCRGADNAEEFTRQRDKIIAALVALDADIVGLLEIENNANDEAVMDLVAGLNDATAPGTYDFVATGSIGTDAIKVALLYQPASVSLLGGYAILDSSVDSRFIDTKNRPVLAQTFIDDTTGGVLTVAVNHLKSKGSACNDVGDPDTGDGSGNCNLTRTAAAAALVDWLAGDPTGSGDNDFIAVGDFNSYDKEDPIDTILAGGYTDLIHAYRGEDAYGYVFDGQIGYLDYALASANLSPQVTGATEWHINADEPDLLDYDTSFKGPNQDAIYAPDAYRASDHDPIVVGLETCDEIAPTIDAISVTPNVLWPANHKYVDITATVLASDNFDPDLTVTLVSVTSNEPDNGVGDGNTDNDIVTVDDFNLMLRAERSGRGSDRVYTLTYIATDDCGNDSETASATVTVPHSKGK